MINVKLKKVVSYLLAMSFVANFRWTFTADLGEAVESADIILIAIPVKFVSEVIEKLKKYYKSYQHICIASKGIEQGSCLFIANIVA